MILNICSLSSGYRPPHRNRIQNELKRLYVTHMASLKRRLMHVDRLALTTDFWTDRKNCSFMCLTGHFVDNEMNTHSSVLHFEKFDGRHFAQNVAVAVKGSLSALNIEDKIVSVTSDGGSNIRVAFNDFYRFDRIWCVAHRLHLVICNGLGLWKKFRKNDTAENEGDDPIQQRTSLPSSNVQNYEDHSMETSEDSNG